MKIMESRIIVSLLSALVVVVGIAGFLWFFIGTVWIANTLGFEWAMLNFFGSILIGLFCLFYFSDI